MDIKDIFLSKEDIKNKIDTYNKDYGLVMTRKEMILRALSKSEDKAEDNLI